ncbi:MAG: hypothetical protein H7228_12005, partial [Polaromonas sp.]|nr:hypothetical protein [Polaromonas sp.]
KRATAAIWVAVFGLGIGACWYFLAGEPGSKSALVSVLPPPSSVLVLSKPEALPATSGGVQYKSAERFSLEGVVSGQAGQGVALISLDGQAAQAFTIGKQVTPGYVLHSVSEGRAMLAERLDLPVKLNLYVSSRVAAAAASATTGSATAGSANLVEISTALPAGTAQQIAGLSAPSPESSAGPPPRMDSRYRLPTSRRPIAH